MPARRPPVRGGPASDRVGQAPGGHLDDTGSRDDAAATAWQDILDFFTRHR